MQVNNIKFTTFKGFYDASANIEERVLWNKAMVTGLIDIGWIAMANNAQERKEKARRFSAFLALSYLTPLLTLPLSNRIAMKYCTKLTKSFWSHNHKAIHLSNKYLVNAEKTKEGLSKLANKYSHSPFEMLWAKIRGKKLSKEPLDFKPLLDKCGGDYEVLRKKLVKAKTGVLASDILFSALATGSVGFINNMITKKQTGISGFSAEMSMADKEIVEKRAKNYEKNWKKRYAVFASGCLAMAVGLPMAIRKGLLAKNISQFTKKYAPKFDYNDGIYMSRWSLVCGVFLLSQLGTLMATRNKTELKDAIARFTTTDTLFFSGDVVMSSLFSNISDKLFKTNLVKHTPGKKTSKILPDFKSLKEVSEEVKAGKISAKNKKIGLGLWWLNMAILTGAIGFGVPKFVNAVTRRDVKKDVEKLSGTNNKPAIAPYMAGVLKENNLHKFINK